MLGVLQEPCQAMLPAPAGHADLPPPESRGSTSARCRECRSWRAAVLLAPSCAPPEPGQRRGAEQFRERLCWGEESNRAAGACPWASGWRPASEIALLRP